MRRETEEREKLAKPSAVIHDPYYNIVEVTVYGQGRFYNPPSEEPEAQSNTEGEAAPDAEVSPTDAATTKSDPAWAVLWRGERDVPGHGRIDGRGGEGRNAPTPALRRRPMSYPG